MRAFILITPILLCAGSAASQQIAAPVQGIALYSYGYNPEPIVLTAGKAVTLNFVNRATKGHDFTAKKFFSSSRIISGNVGEGEVDLAPGRSASVTLIPAAGRYKVHCGHPFHKMLGMSGDIVVR
ncbi:MAG TPA: cupredoxin domain-containing protein [Sphingomicrobium sp.]|nr:cupredoxin domain-containing protein [Sphingomicrobium sp.]